jgi:ribose transport system permease protein
MPMRPSAPYDVMILPSNAGVTSFSGGIGNVFGMMVGALIIAVLNNGLTLLNVSFYWQLVIKGGFIILAITLDKLRPRGQAARGTNV